jgi:hypothetical protein
MGIFLSKVFYRIFGLCSVNFSVFCYFGYMRTSAIMDRYWRLAVALGNGRPSMQVRRWAEMDTGDVARSLLHAHGVTDSTTSLDLGLVLNVLDACLSWAELPLAWRRHGLALLVGAGMDVEELNDCDGVSVSTEELREEWAALSVEPEGYALALTALRLTWTYRHALWEFLLRGSDSPCQYGYERNESVLLQAVLGAEEVLPLPAEDSSYLVGEAVWAGDRLVFVLLGKRRQVECPSELEKLLTGRDLGRARLVWKNSKWLWQWVEADGRPVDVEMIVRRLQQLNAPPT